MIRVAILDDYQNASAHFAPLRKLPAGVEVVVFADHVSDPGEVAARLRHFDIVVTMRGRVEFSLDLLERLTDLRLLVTTGITNPAIDLVAAEACGILVCGTGGYLHSTIELTWGLILGLLRNIPLEAARLRNGGWQNSVGGDLHGATLGVVGLGNMGSGVARIGRAFGMHVVAWSANLSRDAADAVGVTMVDKASLLRSADVVSVHLQLSGARNRGIIGREELAMMKRSAVLVNTSRGPIVEETALLDALRVGEIAGAAIDVFDIEPLPADSPFRYLPNVLATPHIGYVTRNTYTVFFDEIVEDICAYVAGAPIRVLTAAAGTRR